MFASADDALLQQYPAFTVVMDACAGAHFVARKLIAIGHQGALISPQFVKPFVKGNKNDFVDAEAICEAAWWPSTRFVFPKTEAQQTLSVLHRLRESLIRDRTKVFNQMHGVLLGFGISLPQRRTVMKRLSSLLAEHEPPVRLNLLLQRLHDHFVYLDGQIKTLDKELACQLADDDLGSRLLGITSSVRSPPACWPWKWATASSAGAVAILSPLSPWCTGSTALAARPIC